MYQEKNQDKQLVVPVLVVGLVGLGELVHDAGLCQHSIDMTLPCEIEQPFAVDVEVFELR